MQNSWQTDLPVSRNGHVHRQSLMELTWLGPSTVRNPSAENLRVQRSRDPHQKKTAPECISSIAFLNATICPPMSLSQGTKYFGTCIHPSVSSLPEARLFASHPLLFCSSSLFSRASKPLEAQPALDITAFQGTKTSLNPSKTSFPQPRTLWPLSFLSLKLP